VNTCTVMTAACMHRATIHHCTEYAAAVGLCSDHTEHADRMLTGIYTHVISVAGNSSFDASTRNNGVGITTA